MRYYYYCIQAVAKNKNDMVMHKFTMAPLQFVQTHRESTEREHENENDQRKCQVTNSITIYQLSIVLVSIFQRFDRCASFELDIKGKI